MPQTDQNRKNRLPFSAGWIFMLALTVAFVSCVYIITTNLEKNIINEKIYESMQIIKDACQKYEDYTFSISAKEMQSAINKVNILSRYTQDIDLKNKEELREFAEIQYLTGIFILDGSLNVVNSVDIKDKNRDILIQDIIAEGNPQSINENNKKVFAGNIVSDHRSYNYAAAARHDSSGVIVCYTDITDQSYDDKYEFSLSTLLPDDIFGEGAVFVVSDGKEVLCSNRERLEKLDLESMPVQDILEKDELKTDSELVKLDVGNKEWYGMKDKVRGYYIYIFYPEDVVFADRVPIIVFSLGCYILIYALFVLWIQYSKRAKLLQVEKEYHLINAIASIYNNNFLIDLRENTFEIILRTERMENALDGINDLESAFNVIADKFVNPAAKKEFLKFTDMNTVAERMKGKPFLGYTFEGREGKWYQALLIPQTRGTDDEVTAVMFVTRDVSEKMQKDMEYQEQLRLSAEKANRANAAKTDFLRRINHDIRTPINGIVGMLEINSHCDDENIIRENREKAKTAAHHLLSLVNDVLEMSKLEDGIINVEKELFDIKKLADDVIVIAGMRADEQGIKLYPDERVENFAYRYVYGNQLHVRQIFLNILGNAVKYNKPGGSISCTTITERVENNKVWYKFVISDTGIGISEEFLEHIFEPFAQEKSDARTVYRGTGLGMSIVKSLLDSMDGSIEIESEVGVGSTFYITIPFEIAEDQTGGNAYDTDNIGSGAESENGKNSADSISGMNILVAEDNELNMEIAKLILENAGAKVRAVSNGAEAAEAFSSEPQGTYDVILMDIMMPVMDGYEAAGVIRSMAQTRSDAAKIPIIAMTANAFADDRQKVKKAGMNGHIEKPLDIDKMIKVLAEFR